VAHRGIAWLQTIPPAQPASAVHEAHFPSRQCGVLPLQSLDDKHWTQTPASALQRGVDGYGVQVAASKQGIGCGGPLLFASPIGKSS
jgi:hypothetical protein